jgi:disulfide bond formation protein DsbB
MIQLNRNIYLAILLCFFLPFAKGCDFDLGLAEEKLASEQSITDSISTNDLDSSVINTPEIKNSFFKQALSDLLMPGGDYSGFYLVLVGTLSIKGWLSLVPAFLILVSLIYMSFKKKTAELRPVIYLNLAFTIFLILFLAFYFKDLMYGFWITLVLSFVNLIISIRARKDKITEA